ncbi:MAG: metallophosphatase [Armatimonadota bacterium]|nr:metallophosphatase [Armatimonadota bacterium]
MTRRLVIFHTSDIHNRLTPDHVRFLTELKCSAPDSLMLDSGDAIWAGNIFWRPGGEPVLDLMNQVPYDAMCLGNREFHFTEAGLRSKLSRARFPILSANLRRRRSEQEREGSPSDGGTRTHIVLERAGIRVGVIGLSVPCITEQMAVRRISDFFFTDPVETASHVIPDLRKQCDIVVALTHIGLPRDRQLAESVPEIDIILGGHTHTVADEKCGRRAVPVLHHGCHCRFVGRVDLSISADGIEMTRSLIPFPGA